MASNWPTSVDNFGHVTGTESTNHPNDAGLTHAAVHNLLADAVTALETQLSPGGSGGVSTLPSPTTVTYTTRMLAPNQRETGTITLALSYRLLKTATSAACRVRLYDRLAKQTIDAPRSIGIIPTGDHGLVYEFDGAPSLLSMDVTPFVIASSLDTPRVTQIPITIDNLSGITQAITITFTYTQME